MENTDNKDNVIVKYSSYTEAQKKATQKYRNNNRDKVNEQRKKYYKERCENDPNFLLYKRAKAKEYYLRKKEKEVIEFVDEPVPAHVIEEVVNTPIVEPIPIIEEVVVPEVEEVKPKKTRKSKKVEIKEVVPVVIPDVIHEPVVEPTPVVEVKTKRVSRSTAKHTNKK